ncbi:hypothetical protein D3C81_2017930 [compost metagenome]
MLVRPVMVMALLGGRLLAPSQRMLVGWFGIRGIGSLYYLCHALNLGLDGKAAALASDLVLSVVALSILLHGLTIQPLLERYQK